MSAKPPSLLGGGRSARSRTVLSTASEWCIRLTRFSPLGPFLPSNQLRTDRSLAAVSRATCFTAEGDAPKFSFSATANYSVNYAKALLATTKPADLHRPDQLKKATGLSAEQMIRLEREMASVSADYKELEASFGDDTLAAGFLERLISKPEIERFLANRQPEFLETFRIIIQAASLDQPAIVGRR